MAISIDAPVYHCRDCGVNTVRNGEYYMVHDNVWPIGFDDGMLCVGCLERRTGRRLVPRDFTDAPVNREGDRSARLRSRQQYVRGVVRKS
jgi:hypothetical protein